MSTGPGGMGMGPRGRMVWGPAVKGWEAELSYSPPRPPLPPRSGPEVRVLLFNSTGDRDPAALLKLLQVRGGCWVGSRQPRPASG